MHNSFFFPPTSIPALCRYLAFLFRLSSRRFSKENGKISRAQNVQRHLMYVCACNEMVAAKVGTKPLSSSQDLPHLSWPVFNFFEPQLLFLLPAPLWIALRFAP